MSVFLTLSHLKRDRALRDKRRPDREQMVREIQDAAHTHPTHTGRNKTLYRNIIKTTDKHKQRVYYVNIINVISEVSTPYQVPHSEDKPRDGDSDG